MRNKIKNIIKKIPLLFLLIIISGFPSLTYGAPGSEVTTPAPGTETTTSVPGTEFTTPGERFFLKNPLKVKTIAELLKLILDIVTIFAIPIIVFFIIYAGFLFVTAQGKPDQITKAKNALLWSIIGGVIILGANVLLVIIRNTVGSLLSP